LPREDDGRVPLQTPNSPLRRQFPGPPDLHRCPEPRFYQGLSEPFFGANLEGSTATQGMRDLFWFQGLLGGARAQYDTTYSWQLDYTDDIAKCDVPLLVIHCEDDQIVPIEPTGKTVPKIVPHAILKVYPGGSHGIAIVDPDKVNADLLEFIKGE
jgi:non-heme chloroperoxidase